MRLTRSAVFAIAVLMAVPTLQATPLPPDETVIPEELANPGEEADILDNSEGTFSFSTPLGFSLSGEYEHAVLVDPFGAYCADCLAFVYRVFVSPNSQLPLLTLAGGGFEGFETSVAWVFPNAEDEGGVFFGIDPLNANRSPDGNVVRFNFLLPGVFTNVVSPGMDTAYLLIQTNATAFSRRGALGVVSGRDVDDIVIGVIEGMLAPARVPEPASLGMLATGIAGLFVFRRRRVKLQSN
jgi:hypothetical protein